MARRVIHDARTGRTRMQDDPARDVAPDPAELDARADRLAAALDRKGDVIAALAAEVFALARAADPALTPAAFRERVRARIRAGLG